jgi:ABC-type glycerol-3-phosphate transport system permease component
MKIKLSFVLKYSFKYVILIFFSLLTIVPIYWAVVTSFETSSMIYSWPPLWFPNPISLSNYAKIFKEFPIIRMAFNSVIIALSLIVTNVLFCSLAGYVFARKHFPGRDILFALIIGTMMIPMYSRLVPLYLLSVKLGLVNTYGGLILPSAILAFGIFLMRQYISTLSQEIEDAARIDGCSDWGILFRIILPQSKPVVVSLILFTLVYSLHDFLWPLIIISTAEMRPITVGMVMYLDPFVVEWGPLMAMTSILVMPLVILYVFLQSQFEHGLTEGAVKG